jgi:hypothetical protein
MIILSENPNISLVDSVPFIKAFPAISLYFQISRLPYTLLNSACVHT